MELTLSVRLTWAGFYSAELRDSNHNLIASESPRLGETGILKAIQRVTAWANANNYTIKERIN